MSWSTINLTGYRVLVAAAEDPVEEPRRLALLLMQSAHSVREGFSRSIEPFGISPATARALLSLDSPQPMRTLADRMSCDQSYVTGLADELEERGLVTREPGSDRRVKVLTLTKEGAALRRKLARAVSQGSPAMARLTPAERATLSRLLTRVISDAEA